MNPEDAAVQRQILMKFKEAYKTFRGKVQREVLERKISGREVMGREVMGREVMGRELRRKFEEHSKKFQ